MLRSIVIVSALLGGLMLAASVGATSQSRAWSGRWSGHPGPPRGVPVCPGNSNPVGCIPRSTLTATTVQFTFGASGIDYYGEGLTDASHDPPIAKGSCRMRLVLDHLAAGWTYYRRSGPSKVVGEGGPGVACARTSDDVRFAARIRQAGGKLKVDFGDLDFPPSFGDDWPTTYLSRTP
jgi:hypothetical protein